MPSSFLRELQLTELEILVEVDRSCKANGITYMLAAGTLLGAIRHKGFIPWDDNIDIMMPISDYNRFTECAKKELSDVFFLQTYQTDDFHCYYGKVRKNNTTMLEGNKPGADYHCGVWIDIFPIIGVKDDKKWIDRQRRKMMIYKRLYYKISSAAPWNKLSFDKKLLRLIPAPIQQLLLRQFYTHLFTDFSKCASCCYIWGEEKIEPRFSSSLFEETCDVLFEDRQFPAPKRWDEYLTVLYGDYMTLPPEAKRNGGNHTVSHIDLIRGSIKHNG